MKRKKLLSYDDRRREERRLLRDLAGLLAQGYVSEVREAVIYLQREFVAARFIGGRSVADIAVEEPLTAWSVPQVENALRGTMSRRRVR